MSDTETHLKQQQKNLRARATLGEREQNHYRLYWDYTSPYSNKIRAYLNYKEIPYKLIQATNHDYMNKIPELVGMPIIPILIAPDERVMQDSTPIMAWFENEYMEKPAIPDDPRLAWLMWLIEEFADEYMLRIGMRLRWGNKMSLRTSSSRIARGFSYAENTEMVQMVSQFVVERQVPITKTLLGLDREEYGQSVDRQFLDLLEILNAHLAEFGYLLGDRPSLADFGMFGPLWSFGLTEPVGQEILETKAPQVCNWLHEMADFGDSRGCQGREEFGDWLDADKELPETLVQLAGLIAKTYLPAALGYRSAMVNEDENFTTDIYGVETQLSRFDFRAGTFAQLQQRLARLDDSDRDWIEKALEGTGLFPSLLEEIKPNPYFADLTPPFVTDPEKNMKSYRYNRGDFGS
ncbi:MAG: glutathione S-transferase family protein [Deltaproteobacteria bacterium]|jgi:glutathione S-transferase|nr:glutathione S-transferase family protein [Deltaproteobacteria bacterium]MBT6499367.1 glutathione S-transferase family protein [Deltaproteobacteria bacterium]MBT7890485.1 glutathione S-transferase family protein [Deltaproteobacteria bacterium]